MAFDKKTGKSLANAIVWLDKRTHEIAEEIIKKNNGNADAYRLDCGLPINTYFSAQKMAWLLKHTEGLAANENLIMGTIDTYLIANLTQCQSLVTDSTNASRTMLMDINTLEWSDTMLNEYGIKKEWLPTIIKDSSANFGVISDPLIECLNGVVIAGVLGDQQAACLGHVLKEGEVKNTYGTGCFLLQNVGTKPVQSTHGLLTTLCYQLNG